MGASVSFCVMADSGARERHATIERNAAGPPRSHIHFRIPEPGARPELVDSLGPDEAGGPVLRAELIDPHHAALARCMHELIAADRDADM